MINITEFQRIESNNKIVIDISKEYRLRPVLFREILILRSRGFSNKEIAKKTGLNRNTVNKYVKTLKYIPKERVISLCYYIFEKEFVNY